MFFVSYVIMCFFQMFISSRWGRLRETDQIYQLRGMGLCTKIYSDLFIISNYYVTPIIHHIFTIMNHNKNHYEAI